jgi:hypothetical protein
MNVARYSIAVLTLAGAVLAACSGNFGSGTTPPNGLLPSGNLSGINPTPTPTPNSASDIVTYGVSTAFQALPNVAGYGGAIAFPVPSPTPSGFQQVAIGATLAVVAPTDAPNLNVLGPGKAAKRRERPARALAYLTLLTTHDITLAALPRIAIDVPREIVTEYRTTELGLALYNAGAKDTTYRLAVAELDTESSPPPTATPVPSAPPPPTPIALSASPTPSPGGPGTPTPSPGVPTPVGSPTLPPQRIVFAATVTTLVLTANRPVVFALYALPKVTPSPGPSGSGAPAASEPPATPVATSSGTPAPSPAGS